jgi:hypothetical protein
VTDAIKLHKPMKLEICQTLKKEPQMTNSVLHFAALRGRLPGLLAIFSLSYASLSAQPTTIQKAISVGSVSIKAPVGSQNYIPLTVQLQNTSKLPIYAFKIQFVATWPDGSIKTSESTLDFLALYVWAEIGPQPSPVPPIFRSGESYTAEGGVPVADGTAPVSAVATITMVVFEDRTAIGSRRDLDGVSRLRLQQADQYAGVVEDLESILDSPGDPVSAAEARSKELIASKPGDPDLNGSHANHSSPNDMRAQMLLTYVKSVHGDKFRLKKQIVENLVYVSALKLHATLREVAR